MENIELRNYGGMSNLKLSHFRFLKFLEKTQQQKTGNTSKKCWRKSTCTISFVFIVPFTLSIYWHCCHWQRWASNKSTECKCGYIVLFTLRLQFAFATWKLVTKSMASNNPITRSFGADGSYLESKKHRKDGGDNVSRRSYSLDRICDDTNSDSRIVRRNRRQFMHLVSCLSTCMCACVC